MLPLLLPSRTKVDSTRTTCNDVVETNQVLGIEGCRHQLLNELRHALMLHAGGGSPSVNYRHLSLLVDVMTLRGRLTAVTPHGINSVGSGKHMLPYLCYVASRVASVGVARLTACARRFARACVFMLMLAGMGSWEQFFASWRRLSSPPPRARAFSPCYCLASPSHPGPLLRCSFEKTAEVLIDAGMFAELDPLKGVTENIMLGQ